MSILTSAPTNCRPTTTFVRKLRYVLLQSDIVGGSNAEYLNIGNIWIADFYKSGIYMPGFYYLVGKKIVDIFKYSEHHFNNRPFITVASWVCYLTRQWSYNNMYMYSNYSKTGTFEIRILNIWYLNVWHLSSHCTLCKWVKMAEWFLSQILIWITD